MSSVRVTRSSVLGKRGHQQDDASTPKGGQQLQTPEPTPNPKRAKTSTVTVLDGEGNKENIPPHRLEAVNADSLPTPARATRALKRTVTQPVMTAAERPGPRRRASASSVCPSTPTKEIASLAITPPPTPPTLLLPLHARVKSLLRATCNDADATVAGREAEREIISKFLQSFVCDEAMQEDGPAALFISGSPGTGKTALVNAINRELTKENASITVVFVNCMTVKTLDALWDRLIEALRSIHGAAGRSKKEKGLASVVKLLDSCNRKLILVLDELDHVASNPQSLAALFSLSDKTSSALRLVGIANTHTLTANSTCSSVDLSSVQTLHFAPYTPVQLQAIIRTRLADLYGESESSPTESNDIKKLLPNPSLVLLTKRIANLTGDVRSIFEVLRGAIDLAVAAKNQSTSNPLEATVPSVTPQHILGALKAHSPAASKPSNASSTTPTASSSNSEIINKIQNLGLQSRIVLLALLLASKRIEAGLNLTSTNLLASPKKPHASPMKRSPSVPSPSTSSAAVGIDTQQLYAFYTTTLERQETFDPVSRSDFGDLLNILEGVGLVQLSSSLLSTPSPSKVKRAFSRQGSFGAGLGRNGAGTVGEVRLVEGVWTEEVLRGLGISESAPANADGGDLQNEEVKALWLAESNKISKDAKNLALARANSDKERTLGFADASED
ncbi:hypothetical protein H1R20_g14606, partial [Candolleomyces eurysporus]